MCGFQDIFSFNKRPVKLKFCTLSNGIPLISKLGITITYLVFLTFRDDIFTVGHSYTLANSLFLLTGDNDGIWMILLKVVSSAYRMKLNVLYNLFCR